MKRIKKIGKWFLVTVLLLVLVLAATIAMRQDLKFAAPYPDIQASSDSNLISRGKHIVYSQAHCADCHSPQNADSLLAIGIEPSLSGGRLFDIGIAKIYAPNLTSDTIHGIGKRTDGEIARVIRYGVHANGNAVLNFMNYHDLTDQDLAAVISYLRTQQPVANPVNKNEYGLIGKAVKAFMIKPTGPKQPIQQFIQPDSSAKYGEYLVMSTTNCAGCHTKTDLAGNLVGPLMAGGNKIEGFATPNLTPDSSSRIFGWTENDFVDRFRAKKRIAESPMPWNSFKHMTDLELKAIYRYLRTVPAAKMPEVKK